MTNAEKIFLCAVCGTAYTTELSAQECCPPDDAWGCSECGQVYDDENEAEECCMGD